MVIALILLFLVVFFVLGAIAKINTGTAPKPSDLAEGAVYVLLIIGGVIVFFILPIVLAFT